MTAQVSQTRLPPPSPGLLNSLGVNCPESPACQPYISSGSPFVQSLVCPQCPETQLLGGRLQPSNSSLVSSDLKGLSSARLSQDHSLRSQATETLLFSFTEPSARPSNLPSYQFQTVCFSLFFPVFKRPPSLFPKLRHTNYW